MRVIVEGSKKDVDTLIRENRIRASRGVLSFSTVVDDAETEKAEVSVTPKAKVQQTPKAKVQE